MVYPVYKHEGETPLACVQRFKRCFPEYTPLPLTYAGRLDPMASGLLLFSDNESEKQALLGLPKEYLLTILVGLHSDTGDILGIITPHPGGTNEIPEGTFNQPYPAYASKTISGKPLWVHARDGNPQTVLHTVTIYSVEKTRVCTYTKEQLCTVVEKRIALPGDFRQEAVRASCQTIPDGVYELLTFRIRCASGTYMRVLADTYGGLAWKIERVGIGEYEIKKSSTNIM